MWCGNDQAHVARYNAGCQDEKGLVYTLCRRGLGTAKLGLLWMLARAKWDTAGSVMYILNEKIPMTLLLALSI